MIQLTKSQILMLHRAITAEFGGSADTRDDGLLDSALNAPFQTFAGVDLYPTVIEKAARLGYGLIKNHPFADGNKRIGTHAMFVFLTLNQIETAYTDQELIQIILAVAGGEADDEALLDWLRKHIR